MKRPGRKRSSGENFTYGVKDRGGKARRAKDLVGKRSMGENTGVEKTGEERLGGRVRVKKKNSTGCTKMFSKYFSR